MKTKKILAALLSAAMVVTSAAFPVFADNEPDEVTAAGDTEAAENDVILAVDPTPAPWAGTGTDMDPYLIEDVDGLIDFANWNNQLGTGGSNRNFKLTDDVDLTDKEWKPIPFSGTFDGQGYTISGLNINIDTVPKSNNIGLFSSISGSGVKIQNLTVEGTVNVTIPGTQDENTNYYVAGIVGSATKGAVIENCHSNVNVTTNGDYAAGVVGLVSQSTITGCSNSGTVTNICTQNKTTVPNAGDTFENPYSYPAAGGVVGRAIYNSKISGCYNTDEGTVQVTEKTGTASAGGVIGGAATYHSSTTNTVTIEECYNAGIVTSSADDTEYKNKLGTGGVMGKVWDDSNVCQVSAIGCYNKGMVQGVNSVGGIVGNVYDGNRVVSTPIENCYNTSTGQIKGINNVGGIIGQSIGPIKSNNNYGTVSGTNNVGGIVGKHKGAMENCHNTGRISGNNAIGGIAGKVILEGLMVPSTIGTSYNTGEVIGDDDSSDVGGIAGKSIGGTISESFNTGAISGANNIGGIVGSGGNTISTFPIPNGDGIKDSYNTGAVSGTSNIGGIAGTNYCMTSEVEAELDDDGETTEISVTGIITTAFNSGKIIGEGNLGGVAGTTSTTGVEGTETHTYYLKDGDLQGASDKGDNDNQRKAIGNLSELSEYLTDGNVWTFADGTPQLVNNPRPAEHNVIINTPTGGTVKADPAAATVGTKVTLTATADEGYTVVNVTAVGEEAIGLTPGGENTYTFTMPDADVYVTAVFMKTGTHTIVDPPVVDQPKAVEGVTVPGDVLEALESWTAQITDTSELEAIGDMVEENNGLYLEAQEELGVENVEETPVYIHVVTDLEFEVESYDAEEKKLEVDISAVRHIYASTEKTITDFNAANVKMLDEAEGKKITVNKNVQISIPLPKEFASEGETVKIDHEHDDVQRTYYAKPQNNVVSFTSYGLSKYTLTIATEAEIPTVNLSFSNVGNVTDKDLEEIEEGGTKTITVKSNITETTLTAPEGVTAEKGGKDILGVPIELEFGPNIIDVKVGGVTYHINIVRAAPEKLSVYFKKTAAREYDIVIKAPGDEIIRRLNTADLTFKLTTDSDVAYNITPADGIGLIDAGGDRYEFHFADKDGFEESKEDTQNEIKLGTVKFMGYSNRSVEFKVDTEITPDTNIVHATKDDNVVSDYEVKKEGATLPEGIGELEVNSEKFVDAGENVYYGTISDTFGLEQQDVTINVMFPNEVDTNKSAEYTNMTVTVTGGATAEQKPFEQEIKLGTTEEALPEGVEVTNANFKYDETDVAESDEDGANANGYKITLKVPVPDGTGARYTFRFEGDGYRAYSVDGIVKSDTRPFTVTVWNNAMDEDTHVVLKSDGREQTVEATTFLAGDIIENNKIDLYDLSAVVAYFGRTGMNAAADKDYIQYDLNRDGQIDSKDIAMVLVSWDR